MHHMQVLKKKQVEERIRAFAALTRYCLKLVGKALIDRLNDFFRCCDEFVERTALLVKKFAFSGTATYSSDYLEYLLMLLPSPASPAVFRQQHLNW